MLRVLLMNIGLEIDKNINLVSNDHCMTGRYVCVILAGWDVHAYRTTFKDV